MTHCSQQVIHHVQRALNAAARLVLGLRPRDHVTAALINLHWLPVAARIEYKLCTLVYQSVTGNAPTYITDMLQPVSDLDRLTQLRSASKGDLVVPQQKSPCCQISSRHLRYWQRCAVLNKDYSLNFTVLEITVLRYTPVNRFDNKKAYEQYHNVIAVLYKFNINQFTL